MLLGDKVINFLRTTLLLASYITSLAIKSLGARQREWRSGGKGGIKMVKIG